MSVDQDPSPSDEASESVEQSVAVLFTGNSDEIGRLASILATAQIPHAVVARERVAPGTAGPPLFLVTPVDQRDAAYDAVGEHDDRHVDADARARARNVVDLDAAESSCPACGASFATTPDLSACPDCGLHFA